MKTLRTVSAFVLASVLALSTTAMANPVLAPQAAVETNGLVQSVQASLLSEGYTLDGLDEEPRMYLVKPSAPYIWGSLVYSYSRPSHSFALPRQKVELTVELKYLASGVAVPQLTFRELPGQ